VRILEIAYVRPASLLNKMLPPQVLVELGRGGFSNEVNMKFPENMASLSARSINMSKLAITWIKCASSQMLNMKATTRNTAY